MKRILILTALIALLTGCVKTVYVPYAVCPKSPPFAKSETLSPALKPTDPVDKILKAYVADITTLNGDLKACMTLLKAYDSVPSSLPPVPPAK